MDQPAGAAAALEDLATPEAKALPGKSVTAALELAMAVVPLAARHPLRLPMAMTSEAVQLTAALGVAPALAAAPEPRRPAPSARIRQPLPGERRLQPPRRPPGTRAAPLVPVALAAGGAAARYRVLCGPTQSLPLPRPLPNRGSVTRAPREHQVAPAHHLLASCPPTCWPPRAAWPQAVWLHPMPLRSALWRLRLRLRPRLLRVRRGQQARDLSGGCRLRHRCRHRQLPRNQTPPAAPPSVLPPARGKKRRGSPAAWR